MQESCDAQRDDCYLAWQVTKVRRDHGRQLAREHPVPRVADGDPVCTPCPLHSSRFLSLGHV